MFTWRVPADGDADGFVCDGVLLESLFRKAKVPDPTSLVHPMPRGGERKVFENTLHLNWLVEGLRHLEEYGVFQDEDEDGGDDVRVFETPDELQALADEAAAELVADNESWDSFEDVHPPNLLGWGGEVTIRQLVSYSGTLREYVDFGLAVGARDVNSERPSGSSCDCSRALGKTTTLPLCGSPAT